MNQQEMFLNGTMDLIKELADRGGTMKLRPAVRAGLDRDRLPPGVALTGNVLHLDRLVTREQVLAVIHNAVVTCRSAVRIHGLPLLSSDTSSPVHLAVSRNRGMKRSRPRPLRGVVLHRESQPIDEDPSRPWLADLTTTVRRFILCADLREAVAVVDALRFRGAVDLESLAPMPSGPGGRRAREALRRSRAGVRSILETCARLDLEDAGIDVEVAVYVPGVGEVDMLVFGRLVLETDGWEHHSSPARRAHDLERDRALQRMGYLVIRFDYDSVMNQRTLVPEVLAVRDHALSLPAPTHHLR